MSGGDVEQASSVRAISQVLLFVLTAMKVSRSAGGFGIAADAVGVAFALLWPGDSRLEVVAWSIVVSNAVRAIFYVGLWRWIVLPEIDRRAAKLLS